MTTVTSVIYETSLNDLLVLSEAILASQKGASLEI